MSQLIPPELQDPLQIAGGVLLICLGVSYAYKFYQASVLGKYTYWDGLRPFGWYFAPLTILITPLLVHGKPSEKNLLKTKTAGWVHLFWGPAFFLFSLMALVSGADLAHLNGSQFFNWVVTCGNRPGIPPAITYHPPFTYKFPLLKKAGKKVFKILTADIKTDKSKSINALERSGVDVEKYSKTQWDQDEDEDE